MPESGYILILVRFPKLLVWYQTFLVWYNAILVWYQTIIIGLISDRQGLFHCWFHIKTQIKSRVWLFTNSFKHRQKQLTAWDRQTVLPECEELHPSDGAIVSKHFTKVVLKVIVNKKTNSSHNTAVPHQKKNSIQVCHQVVYINQSYHFFGVIYRWNYHNNSSIFAQYSKLDDLPQWTKKDGLAKKKLAKLLMIMPNVNKNNFAMLREAAI